MGMYETCVRVLDADYCKALVETAQLIVDEGIRFETGRVKRAVLFQAEEVVTVSAINGAVLLFTADGGFRHIVAVRLRRTADGFELADVRIANREIVALLNPPPPTPALYLDLATDVVLF